ncbi:hypothetical protein [Paraburkholderia tropica]|uniref:Uncharacterized protein n=1 Tax=Paraburkholderia tropica TaxID=92647 RepID=A0ABX5MYL1_9BURK|nr:hypothetical protein [Paraburkholderia tropica]PXX19400.1 hypothetical protein C7400_103391 [Paraburkholderia tropica]PZW88422.1 hypothetical protein C7399_103390 [Paraburkholderia tropica]
MTRDDAPGLSVLIGLLTFLIETIMAECKRALRFAQFDQTNDRNDQIGDDRPRDAHARARPAAGCGVQDKTKGAALLPALRARVLIDVGGVGGVGEVDDVDDVDDVGDVGDVGRC